MKNAMLKTTLATFVAAAFSVTALAHNHNSDRSSYGDDKQDIVSIAVGDERFSTLVTALETAGLTEALDLNGSYTLFAPTNEAFAALPEGTLESLLAYENRDQLVAILTYHVVPDALSSDAVTRDTVSVTTLQGDDVRLRVSYGNVRVNDATVTDADIEASNGIIHVIDQVIIPGQ